MHHHGNTRAVTQYITMATPELSLNTSPWQHKSCHSMHHHGNTRAVTQYITMATPELSLNTSPWQHQSCHSIQHHGNTRAVTQYITMATPELSLNTSPWQHQSCHSIHEKQSNWYDLFEKVTQIFPSKLKSNALRPVHTKHDNDKDNDISVYTSE